MTVIALAPGRVLHCRSGVSCCACLGWVPTESEDRSGGGNTCQGVSFASSLGLKQNGHPDLCVEAAAGQATFGGVSTGSCESSTAGSLRDTRVWVDSCTVLLSEVCQGCVCCRPRCKQRGHMLNHKACMYRCTGRQSLATAPHSLQKSFQHGSSSRHLPSLQQAMWLWGSAIESAVEKQNTAQPSTQQRPAGRSPAQDSCHTCDVLTYAAAHAAYPKQTKPSW